MPRRTLSSNLRTLIADMSDGNPGGLLVMCELVKSNATIDPESELGEWTSLLLLDDLEIYGGRIWCLYNDLCQRNLARVIACLRGVQLGLISREQLQDAIDRRGGGLRVMDIVARVRQDLPQFDVTNLAAAAS